MNLLKIGAARGILDKIKKSRVSSLISVLEDDRDFINSLYDSGYLSDSAITAALNQSILNEARATIIHIKKTGEYVDSESIHSKCLSYALKNNYFSWYERRVMKKCLDSETTLGMFCQRCSSYDLMDKLKESLLGKK
jgi:hypothetical protein